MTRLLNAYGHRERVGAARGGLPTAVVTSSIAHGYNLLLSFGWCRRIEALAAPVANLRHAVDNLCEVVRRRPFVAGFADGFVIFWHNLVAIQSSKPVFFSCPFSNSTRFHFYDGRMRPAMRRRWHSDVWHVHLDLASQKSFAPWEALSLHRVFSVP